MNRKALIALVVVLAVLGGLGILKKRGHKPPTLVEQAQLATLLPEDLAKHEVARLELFAGPSAEEKLVLQRTDDPDAWQVTSHFSAPVKTDKIEEFLDALVALKGEYRSKADSDEALGKYELGDDAAFHVAGYKAEGADPAFHLLVGKSADYRTIFSRAADSDDVFVIDENLRSSAGIYGDDMAKAPEADTWLNKEVVNIEKDTIDRLELVGPDKHLVFERREKPRPEPEEPAEEPGESEEGEEETVALPEPELPVEYEWVVASGDPEAPFKSSGLDTLLGGLSPMNASDVVDPETPGEYGLGDPAFRCVIGVVRSDEDIVIEGGRPDPSEDGYIRVARGTGGNIYKVSSWNFERLFTKGSDLFTLPGLSEAESSVVRVAVTQPEGGIVLERDADDEWKVVEPQADLNVASSTVSTVARTLASLKATDYASSPEGRGLEAPARRAVFTMKDGTEHTVEVGADSAYLDGAYARIDGDPKPLTLARSDLDKVFVAPKDIYERTLLDLDEADILSMRVEGAEGAYSARRTEDIWAFGEGGDGRDIDSDAFDDLAVDLVDLQATEILFGQTELSGDVLGSILLADGSGNETTITVGSEQDGAHPITVSGKSQVFLIDALDAESILPRLDDVAMPLPEPVVEEEPGETLSEEISEPSDDAAITAEPVAAAPEGS
jgi:uncharacterized protein DUF4340